MKLLLKTITLIFTSALLSIQYSSAQAPNKISYQSIIRNSTGVLLSNATVGIKISVLQGSSSGTVVFSENHTAATNTNGLANVEIGTGTAISGSFANIDWANGTYFLKTETDITGGTNYTITSTTQMLSVPYAMYANSSASAQNAWSINGNTITASNFMGTNNNMPIKFKVNNAPFGILDNANNGNVGIGQNTLVSNNSGVNLVALGSGSLAANTTGNGNTAAGWNALNANTTGGNNVAIGIENLRNNTTGSYNTSVGAYALKDNIGGIENIAVGANSLRYNSSGRTNTAVGTNALNLNASGGFNTAIGSNSLRNNTTANYNTAVGNSAMQNTSTGFANASLGSSSMQNNTSGSFNTSFGNSSLFNNTSGSSNTAIGTSALYNATNNSNVAVGNNSGYDLANGSNNTFMGDSSGLGLTTGSNNLILGAKATSGNGSYNTVLGANASIAPNKVNSTAIGYNAYCASSNAIVLGSGAYVGIGSSKPIVNLDVEGEVLARKRVTLGGYQKDPTTTPTWSIDNYTNMFRVFRQDNIYTPGFTHFSITNDGRVLIGTLDTTRAIDYKLVVNGKAICNELRVQNTSNWPDFVFDESYSLMPISKLSNYLKINKHLPNIPSAKEVETNQNVDVGEMQKMLLQKIEELTLYIINLEDRLQKIEKSK